MAEEKIFADGMSFQRKENEYLIPLGESEQGFILGRLSIKAEDFIAWLKANTNKSGWANINIKKSRGGNFYCDLDTWEPDKSVMDTKKATAKKKPAEDLPF